MKIKFISIYPKDDFDEYITVEELPNWYNFGVETSYKRYYGSGTTWWQEDTDKRADCWTSNILYEIWREQLNLRLENKNCKK